jgi:hypothetical protein
MAEANLQRLGNAIKMFRERAEPKKISQFRLATLMQWEGTAPVIEIEKGRRHPRPETLNALGEALQLSPADIAYLHGLAGYRDITMMPPVEQIKRILQAIEETIANRLYPVYVLDYQFRHWMVNTATAVLLGGSLDLLTTLMQRAVHGFNVVFDSRLPLRQYFIDPEAVERERMFRFKAHNLYRRHEPFYLAYPDHMKSELLEEDYIRFLKCWNDVDVNTRDVFPIHPEVKLRLGSNEFTFVIHMVELLHLDRLIYVAYYEPKDESDNRVHCEAYFMQHSPSEKACIKTWDFFPQNPTQNYGTQL